MENNSVRLFNFASTRIHFCCEELALIVAIYICTYDVFVSVGEMKQQHVDPVVEESSIAGGEVTAQNSSPPVPAAAASPSEIGTDIANQVRAIADGLCDRLDGLIEESPALARGAKRDDKSLRDKLLESWEGRVSLFTKRAFLSSLFLPSFLPSFLPHINTLTTTSPKHPTYHSIYYKNFTFYN